MKLPSFIRNYDNNGNLIYHENCGHWFRRIYNSNNILIYKLSHSGFYYEYCEYSGTPVFKGRLNFNYPKVSIVL